MLTIEEIKQAVDEFKPDGFEIVSKHWLAEIHLNVGGRFCLSINSVDNTIKKVLTERYDLFLDRVIQGINRKEDFFLYRLYDTIDIQCQKKYETLKEIPLVWTTEGIREAREKAIRFVLEEMKWIRK